MVCMFCFFRCLDPSEEIDLINVAFEQVSTVGDKRVKKYINNDSPPLSLLIAL